MQTKLMLLESYFQFTMGDQESFSKMINEFRNSERDSTNHLGMSLEFFIRNFVADISRNWNQHQLNNVGLQNQFFDNVEQAFKDSQTENARLQAENARLQTENARLNQVLASRLVVAESKEKDDEIAVLKSRNNKLKAQVDKLRNRKKATAKFVHELQLVVEGLKITHRQKVHSLESQLNAQLKASKETCKEIKKSLVNNKEKIHEVEVANNRVIQKYAQDFQWLSQELIQLNDTHMGLWTQFQSVEKESDDNKQQIQKLKEENKQLLGEMEVDLATIQNAFRENEERLIREMQEERSQLHAQIESLKDHQKLFAQESTDLQLQGQQLLKSIDGLAEKQNQEQIERIGLLERENAKLQKKVNLVEVVYKQTREQLETSRKKAEEWEKRYLVSEAARQAVYDVFLPMSDITDDAGGASASK